MIDREFESRSGQSKDYEIRSCYFSAKHTLLRGISKGWLALHQNNMWTVSYLYANSTTRIGLVQCGQYNHFTKCIFLAMIYIGNCSSSVNQQSINQSLNQKTNRFTVLSVPTMLKYIYICILLTINYNFDIVFAY